MSLKVQELEQELTQYRESSMQDYEMDLSENEEDQEI